MRLRSVPLLVTLAFALVACEGDATTSTAEAPEKEAPAASPEPESPEEPEASPDPDGSTMPATKIESMPEPDEPVVKKPATGKWAAYTKVLPFEIGIEKGLAAAKAAGKPAMLFYTATW